jgi:hypothetical protein
MILRRGGLKPLCRQCGHQIDRPTARCPMCGMRTGLAEPLRSLARKAVAESNLVEPIAEPILVVEDVEEGDFDDADDIVLAPPVERPVEPMMPLEWQRDDSGDSATSNEPAPIARNVSLGSLMLGTLLIAACLGLGRASPSAGIVAFLILIPAYIRTLSAIYYYRQRERQLCGQDIAAVFATSFVLSLMGLSAGGLVFLMMVFVVGLIAGLAGWDDPGRITTFVGAAAAFVTVLILVHKVWPVNEE